MTITLLDLYNSAASQEWAMYDSDATSESEFEDSLVLAINKSILEIYLSYSFPFRYRTQLILTVPHAYAYDMPNGIMPQEGYNTYSVKYNGNDLKYISSAVDLENKEGVPEYFYIQDSKLVFYPTPSEKGFVTVDYITTAIGEDSDGNDIYSLKHSTDKLSVPLYLEELMKEAIISRTMLNTIASESDENFSAYKKQADKALRLLIKYSKGIERDKGVMV